jgi:large-conductance mechanosensitive channel
MRFHE